MIGLSVYFELTSVNKKLKSATKTKKIEIKKPAFAKLGGYTSNVLLKKA